VRDLGLRVGGSGFRLQNSELASSVWGLGFKV
jgi:hypothetical protein